MTPLEREIARERARLIRAERRAAARIVHSHQRVMRRLQREFQAVQRLIVDARERGVEVRPGWLFAQERFAQLLAEVHTHSLTFSQQALHEVEGAKQEGVGQANRDVLSSILTNMGPAPSGGEAAVRGTINRLSGAALDRMIRNAGDGRPLGRLFAQFAPQAVEDVRDAFAYGVAGGKPVRAIAAEVRKAAGIPLSRSLTISRTEVLRVYRETALHGYRSSKVVKGWVWMAQLDNRTCELCYAMAGTEHPLSEGMDSHVCCRCTPAPLTKSWRELGFNAPDGRRPAQNGEAVFRTLSEADKVAILGRTRLDAYNAGKITLADLVRIKDSGEWGRSVRPATLKELSLA